MIHGERRKEIKRRPRNRPLFYNDVKREGVWSWEEAHACEGGTNIDNYYHNGWGLHNVLRNGGAEYKKYLMCPYTPLIPLQYLNRGPHLELRGVVAIDIWNDIILNFHGLLDHVKLGSHTSPRFTKDSGSIWKNFCFKALKETAYNIAFPGRAKMLIKRYLEYDHLEDILGKCTQNMGYLARTKDEAAMQFCNQDLTIYIGRVFRAVIGSFSLLTEGKPQILGVVLPENYMYQRHRVLLGMPLDYSRVEVLVNRELDKPDFPLPALRNLYKLHLLPVLKARNINVWKVPLEYIEGQCFVQPTKITSHSYTKRKEEMEGMLEALYSLPPHEDLKEYRLEEEAQRPRRRRAGIQNGQEVFINVGSRLERQGEIYIPPGTYTTVGEYDREIGEGIVVDPFGPQVIQEDPIEEPAIRVPDDPQEAYRAGERVGEMIRQHIENMARERGTVVSEEIIRNIINEVSAETNRGEDPEWH